MLSDGLVRHCSGRCAEVIVFRSGATKWIFVELGRLWVAPVVLPGGMFMLIWEGTVLVTVNPGSVGSSSFEDNTSRIIFLGKRAAAFGGSSEQLALASSLSGSSVSEMS